MASYERGRPRRRSASRSSRTGDSLARWQISLASRRPSPAMRALVAQEPVQPHRLRRRRSGAQLVGRRRCRRRGRGRRAAAGRRDRRATDPHAGLLLRAGLGEQQRRPSSKRHRARPPRGLADCFSSGFEPSALHQVDDEARDALPSIVPPASVIRSSLPRRPTPQRQAVGLVGAGAGRLQRGEGQRGEPLERGSGEVARRAARRGPGPRVARACVDPIHPAG